MAILSDTEIKTWVGKSQVISTPETALIALLKPLATAALTRHVGFCVEQATFTEYGPKQDAGGAGGAEWLDATRPGMVTFTNTARRSVLQLTHKPVRSITSIYEDPAGYFGQAGAFGAETLLDATQYALMLDEPGISETGQVWRIGGSWCGVPGSLKATYVAGYSDDELSGARWGDLKLAAMLIFQAYWTPAKLMLSDFPGGIPTAVSAGGGVAVQYVSEHLFGLGIPDRAAGLLERYTDFSDYSL